MSAVRIVALMVCLAGMISLGCAQPQVQNPLGGKVRVLCLDPVTNTLKDCPEEDMGAECHEEAAPKGKDL